MRCTVRLRAQSLRSPSPVAGILRRSRKPAAMRAPSLFVLFAFVVLLMASPAFADPQPGIAALQVALHARGLYQGALDGRLGPKTNEAVRAFQRRQGLHVDGVPGPRTRAALGPYAKYELGRAFCSGARPVGTLPSFSSCSLRAVFFRLHPTVVTELGQRPLFAAINGDPASQSTVWPGPPPLLRWTSTSCPDQRFRPGPA